MYLFSKDYFLKSLKQLTVTEEQIRSLGTYIKIFKKEYKNILEVFSYVYKESSLHHKLVLMYLVNEILQTDKNYDEDSMNLKSGFRQFIIENFAKSKVEAVKYPMILKKFQDLEKVWEQRNVIVLDQVFNIEEFFSKIDTCNGDRKKIIEILEDYLTKLKTEENNKKDY
ncbi:regulation of nuclear pre-mRNA domain-containing protein [Vairimorpha necatrix]|uniref:Regulation of nuclear pre-mRNA domain-containing protein n=1 Tax=Vairimorpha necatrix TaxID=6039 RepID=A0AAX4JCW5_9MICR